MRFDVVGLETKSLLIVSHRFLQVPQRLEGHAQIVVRLGEIGFETDGLLIVSHCFLQLAPSP